MTVVDVVVVDADAHSPSNHCHPRRSSRAYYSYMVLGGLIWICHGILVMTVTVATATATSTQSPSSSRSCIATAPEALKAFLGECSMAALTCLWSMQVFLPKKMANEVGGRRSVSSVGDWDFSPYLQLELQQNRTAECHGMGNEGLGYLHFHGSRTSFGRWAASSPAGRLAAVVSFARKENDVGILRQMLPLCMAAPLLAFVLLLIITIFVALRRHPCSGSSIPKNQSQRLRQQRQRLRKKSRLRSRQRTSSRALFVLLLIITGAVPRTRGITGTGIGVSEEVAAALHAQHERDSNDDTFNHLMRLRQQYDQFEEMEQAEWDRNNICIVRVQEKEERNQEQEQAELAGSACSNIEDGDGDIDFDTNVGTDCNLSIKPASSSTTSSSQDSVPLTKTASASTTVPSQASSPSLVLCTVDGSIIIVDAYSGILRNGFSSGMPLVSASSSLDNDPNKYGVEEVDQGSDDDDDDGTDADSTDADSTDGSSTSSSTSSSSSSSGSTNKIKRKRSRHHHRRIVPGLNGRLYLSLTESGGDGDSDDDDDDDDGDDRESNTILQPLAITILDVLQNPVKTCHTPTDCGIVTATKATSLFALDAYTGRLLWRQDSDGNVVKSKEENSSSSPAVLLQREDVLVRQLSTVSGNQMWNVTLGTFQALEFGESEAAYEQEQQQKEQQHLFDNRPEMLLLEGPICTERLDGEENGGIGSEGEPMESKGPKVLTVVPLPSIIFGPDGLSVTAVDPLRDGHVLWHNTFPTVVASAFGLSGTVWKPLNVITDDDDDEAGIDGNEFDNDERDDGDYSDVDMNMEISPQGSASAAPSSDTPLSDLSGAESSLMVTHVGPGRGSSFLPHSHQATRNRFKQFQQWELPNDSSASNEVELSPNPRFSEGYWREQLENHLAFLRLREKALEFYNDHGRFHPFDCLVPGVCGQLQLPAPSSSSSSSTTSKAIGNDRPVVSHINYQLVDSGSGEDDIITSFLREVYHHPLASRLLLWTPSGLFMSWPLMATIIGAVTLVVYLVVRVVYQRKKRQWFASLNAHILSTTPKVSFDSSTPSFAHAKSSEGDPNVGRRTWIVSSSSRALRRSQSMPAVPNNDNDQTEDLTIPFMMEPVETKQETSSPSILRKAHRHKSTSDAILGTVGNERENQDDGGSTPTALTKPTTATVATVNSPNSANVPSPSPSPPPPPPPQGVGVIDGIPLVRYSRYDSEFQEQTALGKGGFGTVFKCQNALDGREYAIKKVFIKHNPSVPSEFSRRLKRVLREVKILAVLDHPNIVRYYTAWLELEQSDGSGGNNQNQSRSRGQATYDDSYQGISTEPTPAQKAAAARLYSTDLLASSFSSLRNRAWVGSNGHHKHKHNDYTDPLGLNNRSLEDSLDDLDRSEMSKSLSQIRLDDYGFTFERSEDESAGGTAVALSAIQEAAASTSDGGNQARNTSLSSLLGDATSRDASSSPSVEQSASWSQEDTDDVAESHVAPTETESKKVSSVASAELMRHTLYIQMQLCSQKTLGDFLADKDARRGPTGGCHDVDIPYALSLFLQIAQGVTYVHGRGLIHRDLKPNNCFMDDKGVVKVGDFGLSRESGGSGGAQGDEDQQPFVIMDDNGGDNTAGVGTRSYASPEQMSGSDYDSSTDVYSLGIILFELCYPMYTGMERYIVFSKLRKGIFPDQWMNDIAPSYPILHPLLVSMISTQPPDRPTADTVVRKIRSILEEFTITSLDRYKYEGLILLRVEAKPREDVLRRTMDIIRVAAEPHAIEIRQYGLRGGTNKTIMEFAIASDEMLLLGPRIVSKAMESEDVLLIRQVSGTKYT